MRQLKYPQEQVEFMRDMLSGLPVNSISVSPQQTTLLGDIVTTVGGLASLTTMLTDPKMSAVAGPIMSVIDGLFPGWRTSSGGGGGGSSTTSTPPGSSPESTGMVGPGENPLDNLTRDNTEDVSFELPEAG